ncbi:NAD(P)-dependent oxidoreductase [Desulfovibrio sp. UIB00]|uniref:NAD-dependent epimerase/dehydratase family protein n=1 Tax=Desulfovibrio sp. UIB00 TaxID=2804314 RepID=UPI001F0F708A|nr:NAD(P)-dependent oxidoreductase [Desulfovibrio sp. UIB00]MCH5146299.1 NAD(P)-dependent oxidoreductase [Desulfovibrio sp. UIB00]
MAIYVNGMGGGIGQALWPVLSGLGAKRISGSPAGGDLICDLQNLLDTDGNWFRPGDVFIFPAAWSKPDQCRQDPGGAWLVNVENTGRLIEKALEKKTSVIFFSSDTVYGEQHCTLTENSQLLATEEYGKMKAAIEKKFSSASGFCALRLSYVTSLCDGVTRYFSDCASGGKTAEVFEGYERNMVWIDDVVATVCSLTEMALCGDVLPKAVNVGGAECISRGQMAAAYVRAVDASLQYREVAAPENFFSSRPRKIALDVSLLTSILRRSPVSLDEGYGKYKGVLHG